MTYVTPRRVRSGQTTVTVSGEPAWLAGLAPNTWTRINGSSMSNTPPSVLQTVPSLIQPAANRVNAWNGFALDSRSNTLWSLGNGGHGDYYGNEVMRLNLNANTPTWIEWLPSTRYNQAFDNASRPASPRVLAMYCADAGYVDKSRLTGQHSYYNHIMLERQNRVMRVYSGSVSSGPGTGFWDCDGFNVNCAQGASGSVAFDPEQTFPKVYPDGSAMLHAGGTCKDPDTEQIYFFPSENGTPRRFTPNASTPGGSWANLAALPAGLNGTEAMTAFDTQRKRVLVLGIQYPYDTNDIRAWALNTLTNTWSSELTGTMTGAAKATLIAARACGGMVYVPALDAYLVRLGTAGSQVIKIDAATWAVTFLGVTGGTTIAATGNVGGPTLYENVYNKWLFVPSLRGCVYYPEYSSDLWFLRLY